LDVDKYDNYRGTVDELDAIGASKNRNWSVYGDENDLNDGWPGYYKETEVEEFTIMPPSAFAWKLVKFIPENMKGFDPVKDLLSGTEEYG